MPIVPRQENLCSPRCTNGHGGFDFTFIRTTHLIARPNWTNDPDAPIELGEFLEQALTAANTKARKLGWIV